jgi:HTH-type transcriptional regulator, competence development regulator
MLTETYECFIIIMSKGVCIMPNEFGRILRKIRIDHGEILKDMAVRLNISSAYLSAMEVGKRIVPKKVIDEITLLYNLDESMSEKLRLAAEDNEKTIQIRISDTTPEKRNAALVFARNFDNMDSALAEKIVKLMREAKG